MWSFAKLLWTLVMVVAGGRRILTKGRIAYRAVIDDWMIPSVALDEAGHSVSFWAHINLPYRFTAVMWHSNECVNNGGIWVMMICVGRERFGLGSLSEAVHTRPLQHAVQQACVCSVGRRRHCLVARSVLRAVLCVPRRHQTRRAGDRRPQGVRLCRRQCSDCHCYSQGKICTIHDYWLQTMPPGTGPTAVKLPGSFVDSIDVEIVYFLTYLAV